MMTISMLSSFGAAGCGLALVLGALALLFAELLALLLFELDELLLELGV